MTDVLLSRLNREEIADKLISLANEGDVSALKYIYDRIDGTPRQSIDVRTDPDKEMRDNIQFMKFRLSGLCHDVQRDILMSKSSFKAKIAGRRAGKTESNTIDAIDQAITVPGSKILFIALTFTRAIELYWETLKTVLDELGFKPVQRSEDGVSTSRTEGVMVIENGSEFHFHGNSTAVEREKLRGSKWHLVVIDEAQSHKDMKVLIEEILEPALMDYKGKLIISGTAPRVRNTYWEKIFTEDRRFKVWNWNITHNPFIPDHETALARVREEKGWNENNPTYLREYLGLVAYDDDALVFRLNDKNRFTDEIMLAWLDNQSPEDIRFVAGLDFGFRDSDAFVIIMYSETSNEKWIVYEHKQAGADVTQLCDAIKEGLVYIKTSPLFQRSYHRDCPIYADTSDQKISLELSNRYGITVYNAIKYDKAMAVQNLQEEVRFGNIKAKHGSEFDKESLLIVFKRDEANDTITREIDDETYHPDMMDAVLYALRHYWLTHSQNHAIDKLDIKQNNEVDEFLQAQQSRRKQELY